MPVRIVMPALSPTMTEGKIAKWLKKEGDTIKSGDILAEIETDKATMEYEATDDGVLGKILVGDGTDNVAVNSTIGVLLEKGDKQEDIESFLANEVGSGVVTNTSNASVNEVNSGLVVASSIQNMSEENYSGPTKTMTMREALNLTMKQEMRLDPDVFLIGEEVGSYQGAYKISQGMLEEFGPNRIVDTPISEYGFTGIGVGAAMYGLKPIVEYMTFNFAMQAIDHIINSAAKTLYMSGGEISAPIVFRGLNGAGTRVGAQHSQCYASWYSHVPGLIVMAPYSPEDAMGLLRAAIRNPNPVVFLEHEILYGESGEAPENDDNFVVPIGKAKIERVGSDVTIVAYSIAVKWALQAAEKLAEEGISAEVINLRTLRPLDIDTIVTSIQKTNRVVAVEEGWPYGGVAAEIVATIMEKAFDYLDAPLARVCGKDIPMPYAANLEKMTIPSVEEIVEAVKKVSYK